MLISAGAVFSLSTLFQYDDPLSQLAEYSDYIADATVGIHDAIEPLGNLEDSNPTFRGTEGRAAAAFTYGMVDDPAYVDYGIAMMEGCNNWICNWTSKLAPFKPIGQLMTLAELYAIQGSTAADSGVRAAAYDEMNSLLDRAAMLGTVRGYPFMDRIESLRTELPNREYTDGIGLGRSPMPIYSNETNCSNCHIGGLPGRYGEDLDDPYPGAGSWSAKPGPPAFKSELPVSCD